jgi:hypothetical protein
MAHAAVVVLAYSSRQNAKFDVTSVYGPWAADAVGPGHAVVGITEPWVYPVVALVPILAAQALSWIGSYTVAWVVLVVLLDGVGYGVLLGNGRSPGRRVAAYFWMASLLALGPVAIYRLEAISVPLAVLGSLWLMGRPWLGSSLLAVATWIKVWPAALLAAAVIAGRRRLAVLGGAVVVSVVVAVVVVLTGGAEHLLSFLTVQSDRALQVEAVPSIPYVWGVILGVDGVSVYLNRPLITYEVTGAHALTIASAMTPLLAVTVIGACGVGWLKARRGASFAALYPPLSLTLVLLLIVVNKVGSPQYYAWLVAPLVLALVLDRRRWLRPAALAVVISGLSQAVFPWLYQGVLHGGVFAAVVLTTRNVLAVALLVWVAWRLWRVEVAPRERSTVAPSTVESPTG